MKKLPVVRDYMTAKLKTLERDTDIYEAVDFLLKHKISGAPVVDKKGSLIGIISEKDCLKLMATGVDHDTPSGTVGDFMTINVETVSPTMDVYYAAGLFLKKIYRRFPVVEDGKLIGQISRRDVLRAIQETLESTTDDLPPIARTPSRTR